MQLLQDDDFLNPAFVPTSEYVDQELHRHNRQDRWVRARARDVACGVVQVEANPVVRAVFGVERAIDEGLQGLSFNHAVPQCFVDGFAFNAWFDVLMNRQRFDLSSWTAFRARDIPAIRKLQAMDFIGSDVISALWQPEDPSSIVICDPMRPPVEALALAAAAVTRAIPATGVQAYSPKDFPAVLGIGMGFASAAQALSVLLPGYRVYHAPVPYLTLDLPDEDWAAVVLNVPGAHAWTVADLLSQRRDTTYLERRAILAGKKREIDDTFASHVIDLLDVAVRHRAAGKPLIVMGDPEGYHVAVRALVGEGFITAANIDGLDTSTRGIWIDYAPGKKPWAPHRIPGPTGKVISFWRWL